MGKSLNGKELGKGITQRKSDGLYQARFINRFGKRQTIYANSYNGITKKLREEKYADEKAINVVNDKMTLDEWFQQWMNTCKKNCRNNSKQTYVRHYKRIQESLGWRKLKQLNLIVMQEAINNLKTDNERKNSKKILVDMLNKAVDSDLLTKNVAKQINTVVTKEKKKSQRVLTKEETKIFLKYSRRSTYYNLFVVALETGMRIGELTGLQWEDIDFEKKVVHVRHSLCYFQNKDGKYVFEMHDVKTDNGFRDIPLTSNAILALRQQYFKKQRIINSGKEPIKGYEDIVFFTLNHKPTTEFLVTESINGVLNRIKKDNPDIVFEKIAPHTFRHTFATRYIEAGVQPKTVQKLLGHSKLQTTMDLYCHVTDDTLYEEVRRYEKIYSVG